VAANGSILIALDRTPACGVARAAVAFVPVLRLR